MNPPPEKKRLRPGLRERLKALAWSIAAEIAEPLPKSVRIVANGRDNTVTVIVTPAGEDAEASGQLELMLSPMEARIVEKIQVEKAARPRRALAGKGIAALLEVSYDVVLKTIIRNLVDRQILTHDEAKGYAVAHPRSRLRK